MATSFSGGRSRSIGREPQTMDKQLVNFITCGCRIVNYSVSLNIFWSFVPFHESEWSCIYVFVCYGYWLSIFIWYFYWNLKLSRHCGILCFSYYQQTKQIAHGEVYSIQYYATCDRSVVFSGYSGFLHQ